MEQQVGELIISLNSDSESDSPSSESHGEDDTLADATVSSSVIVGYYYPLPLFQ